MKGYFDYIQYHLTVLIEEFENLLSKQGEKKEKEDLYFDSDFYKKYPEEQLYPSFSEKIQEKMKDSIKYLSIAFDHVNHLDSFLSGDCSEEMALERLEKDLSNKFGQACKHDVRDTLAKDYENYETRDKEN